MSSSDYGEAGPHVYEIAEELRTNFTIQGNPYNNIMLDIDQPNFTSTHDPEIVITRDAATLFWPGGSPVHGGSFETVAFEQMHIRRRQR